MRRYLDESHEGSHSSPSPLLKRGLSYAADYNATIGRRKRSLTLRVQGNDLPCAFRPAVRERCDGRSRASPFRKLGCE
jgi:hypothetical protein